MCVRHVNMLQKLQTHMDMSIDCQCTDVGVDVDDTMTNQTYFVVFTRTFNNVTMQSPMNSPHFS